MNLYRSDIIKQIFGEIGGSDIGQEKGNRTRIPQAGKLEE